NAVVLCYTVLPELATTSTEFNALSLHDALPIWPRLSCCKASCALRRTARRWPGHSTPQRIRARPALPGGSPHRSPGPWPTHQARSEEHTSELQSREKLVCRLLLEKKKVMSKHI